MGERKAVTKHMAESYRAGDRARRGRILEELVELIGWTHPGPWHLTAWSSELSTEFFAGC